MKRLLDFVGAAVGLLVVGPVLALFCLLIWLGDRASPLFIARRIGLNGQVFRMIKLRSMRPGSELTKVDSTSVNDPRITRIGGFVRRWKLDELSQLWNVLIGDMSMVGPRPNVEREVALYSEVEKGLLTVRPGITDLSSIVFSDLNDILDGAEDANIAYNQLVRPWKSRLGLLYAERRSLRLDLELILLTLVGIISRPTALRLLQPLLRRLGASEELQMVCRRDSVLSPHAPPGIDDVVTSREVLKG